MARAAIIFDLDRVLIDSRAAWCYALEESVLSTCGNRVSVRELYDEYHTRPVDDALSVLVPDFARRDRCAAMFARMSQRSAMKRLLVFDGLGMALDELRGMRIDVGAISRNPHAVARKQIESTGIDRFLAVLEATGEGECWDAAALVGRAARYLETDERRALYVGIEPDVDKLEAAGLPAIRAGWVPSQLPAGRPQVARPRDLVAGVAKRVG
jgi:beta-phosphoglucomutase-like phosphatase (HAD superfamily)